MRRIVERRATPALWLDRDRVYVDGGSPYAADPNPMPRLRLFRWLPSGFPSNWGPG